MASLFKADGGWRIEVVIGDGRKSIRLGQCTKETAAQAQVWIERLVAAKVINAAMDSQTAQWVAGLDDKIHGRLAAAGLVPPRVSNQIAPLLAEFIDGYIAQRADLKETTLTILRQTRVWLVRFVGEDRRMDDVSPADADAYKSDMVRAGLAKATINKRCRYCRHFFEVAIRRGIVKVNPFAHIKGAVIGNMARRVFVPADTVAKVMEQMPSPQWRLLVALARWGGLRIPSEAAALVWSDIDFAGKRFIVRASKTEGHDDGGIRIVPMFPELEPLFQAVFDQAPTGTTQVLTIATAQANLRTQFQRYILRAGVKPWPKLWQNLRATRATELADKYPSHVCAAWLGHTERIADGFYRMTTDEHFAMAVAPEKTAAFSAAVGTCLDVYDGVTELQNPSNIEELHNGIGVRTTVQSRILGGEGLEPPTSAV